MTLCSRACVSSWRRSCWMRVAPKRVNLQVVGAADGARLGHEERPPLRQVGVARLHEALITFAVLEQVNLHDRVAGRQLQFLVDLVAHPSQFLEQRLVARHLEVGQEHVRAPRGTSTSTAAAGRRAGPSDWIRFCPGRGFILSEWQPSISARTTAVTRQDRRAAAAGEGVVCTRTHENLDSPAAKNGRRVRRMGRRRIRRPAGFDKASRRPRGGARNQAALGGIKGATQPPAQVWAILLLSADPSCGHHICRPILQGVASGRPILSVVGLFRLDAGCQGDLPWSALDLAAFRSAGLCASRFRISSCRASSDPRRWRQSTPITPASTIRAASPSQELKYGPAFADLLETLTGPDMRARPSRRNSAWT